MKNKFKESIKELRKIKNLTQEKLAEELNVSRKAVSHWETGTTEPNFDMLIKIAKFFDETTDSILGIEK